MCTCVLGFSHQWHHVTWNSLLLDHILFLVQSTRVCSAKRHPKQKKNVPKSGWRSDFSKPHACFSLLLFSWVLYSYCLSVCVTMSAVHILCIGKGQHTRVGLLPRRSPVAWSLRPTCAHTRQQRRTLGVPVKSRSHTAEDEHLGHVFLMKRYVGGNTHGPRLCAHTWFYAAEWNSPYSERHRLIYELPHLLVKHMWPKQSPLRYSGPTAAMLIMTGWRSRKGEVYHAGVFMFSCSFSLSLIFFSYRTSFLLTYFTFIHSFFFFFKKIFKTVAVEWLLSLHEFGINQIFTVTQTAARFLSFCFILCAL